MTYFLRLSLSIVSLNARGLRNSGKRKALFLFAKQCNSDLVFFQECHSTTNEVNFWRSQWGNDICLSHGSERSAGVGTFKNNFSGKVLHSVVDPQGHYISQVIEVNTVLFIITNIYGYNVKSENEGLLDSIEQQLLVWLDKFPGASLLIGGDFNVAQNSQFDRWPAKQNSSESDHLKRFMQRFDLIDIWREKFPNDREYTWSNKTRSSLSRIDYWLISGSLRENTTASILTTPLTDHKAISIKISIFPSARTFSSYWKLNNSILGHETVITEVKRLIQRYHNEAICLNKFCSNWELLKFEVAKFLRKYSSHLAKSRRKDEENVVSVISALSQRPPETLSDSENLTLAEFQNKLDEIYKLKAEGAFVRSRQKWIEKGEQNSSYFFKLEKFHSRVNSIHQLKINNIVCNDSKLIAKYCSDFYKDLYTSQYCETSATSFLDSVEVNHINIGDRELCDAPLTLQEVIDSINTLKLNKSPGVDGLTSEFYRAFVKQLAPFLLNVYLESISSQSLPPTLTQGLITLIPKPNKDVLLLDNWRPISLLNNDYKVLAISFAKRLKSVLESIIDETQSGFMRNRHIANNIRLVLDILDYPDLILDDSLILFLDFRKAFDTVEYQFIFDSLEKFGFGQYFVNTVRTLYANGNSSIKLSTGTTPRFDIKRGIRQGCPISPYLFLLVTQLLSSHIKTSTLKGISVANREVIISQLADDTTLFLKNPAQVSLALSVVDVFSKASGLYLNVNKCELLSVKQTIAQSIAGIPVKESVTYLGLCINKDQKYRSPLNFSPIVKKTRKKLNMWLLRDLSLKGSTVSILGHPRF